MLAASQGFGSILGAMRIFETSLKKDRTQARIIVHALKREARKWEDLWFSQSKSMFELASFLNMFF
jgi:hypothetical protein